MSKNQNQNQPLKVGDTLWYVTLSGQIVLSDEANTVTVTQEVPFAGQVLLRLSTGAVIHPQTLRGYLEREVIEDFGKVKMQPHDPPDKWVAREKKTLVRDPVRCWLSKAHWQEHVTIQRAWNKLASRILQHSPDDMDPFTVDDIEAAELALFGDIQK